MLASLNSGEPCMFVTHTWFNDDCAAPAYDITHLRLKSNMRSGGDEDKQRKGLKVKFRNSKYLKEIREIPYDNRGNRVSDEPNEGEPVTDFTNYFKGIEYSNACAIAKARLINISREAHLFRRRVYKYSLPESSVIC